MDVLASLNQITNQNNNLLYLGGYMINDGINDVPKNTIALFHNTPDKNLSSDEMLQNITKPPKKRDWFSSNFYNCLPLMIGNQYGFIVTLNYGVNIMWNGGDGKDDINVSYIIPDTLKEKDPTTFSHFGNGILTVSLESVIRTPTGINLMTINPPNYILKNVTVLTGVVESDNLRMPFTINLRIHEPNIITSFPAGTPIAAFIPIPRMFADQFELRNATDIFEDKIVQEELEVSEMSHYTRDSQNKNRLGPDRNYFRGLDILGNKFKEHQNANGKLEKNR
jgi:hypothetical protein